MKLVKAFLILLGFYILYRTVEGVGLQTLIEHLSRLGWKLAPVLVVYPLIFAFDTMGWIYSFPRPLPTHVTFRGIYAIRIIGETLNCVIPFSASLGGEPVKVELLKRRFGVPLSDGLASILIVHTTFWVSLNAFVIGAIAMTLKSRPLTPVLWNSVLAFLVILGVAAVLLIVGLHLGIFQKVHAIGNKWKILGGFSPEKLSRFLRLDGEIRDFYTRNPRRFFLSTAFNFLGWFMGVFEVYFVMQLLGIPMSLSEAWLFEALIQVLRIVTFFIPSSIGAQEGGIVLIFSQFGYATSLGLTFALLRRVREIIWITFGLFLWSLIEDKPALAKPSSS